MRADDIDYIVSLCRARAGLAVAPEKTYLIEMRLGAAARREGFAALSQLLAATRHPQGARWAWTIVEAMASPETRFFRDKAVFGDIRARLLPSLRRARGSESVRIWSAGCSTGQEIYSLALIARDLEAGAGGPAARLVASDLCQAALERAREGLYSQTEVQKGLPIRALIGNFRREGEMWRLDPAVRAMVDWRRANLVLDPAPAASFDLILCRNVLVDLEPEARAAAMKTLTNALAPDGYLVLGTKDAGIFNEPMFASAGAGIYRREGQRAAAAA